MMESKEKDNVISGFTLVELLAVIVILAIILVIAVPKVMSIIEDAKMGTLESTAKMIASQAEKQKVQNTVLGNDEAITCDSVAKINDVDYKSCIINFENDTAKVTIEGSGKFDGLSICGGDKTSAVAQKEECVDNSGVAYIEDLLAQESTLNNGLFVDDTEDQNIRYHGENPNNKVYFNCKDTHNGKSYGSEGYDYPSACEVWRIIGIFDVKTNISDTYGSKRIKIVREAFKNSEGNQLSISWDSSAVTINEGYGINEWSESDLKSMLNEYYLGTSSTCIFCSMYNQEICSRSCTSEVTPLSSTSQKMIGQAVWSTRGIEDKSYTAKEMYEVERTSSETGKSLCKTGKYCTDNVERKIEWEGKIGLIYPSDWGYASTDETCTNIRDENGTCKKNNWLYFDAYTKWTILPYAESGGADRVWVIASFGVGLFSAGMGFGVCPTTYLKSDIQIIGGNGTDDEPFKLAL